MVIEFIAPVNLSQRFLIVGQIGGLADVRQGTLSYLDIQPFMTNIVLVTGVISYPVWSGPTTIEIRYRTVRMICDTSNPESVVFIKKEVKS